MAFSAQVLTPGKVAVITGASSGIGRALAVRCVLTYRMHCVLVDLDEAELSQTAAHLREAQAKAGSSTSTESTTLPPGQIVKEVVDVADASAVHAMAERTFATFGAVHLLVNNAGIGAGGGALAASFATIQKVMNVNTYGPIHGCQAFVTRMKSQHLSESKSHELSDSPPSIPPLCYVINTGSKQGITMPPGNVVYNMSKAALKCYTEGLEHEMMMERRPTPESPTGAHNVHAALLVPGWVNTSIMLKSQRAAALASGRTDYDPVKEAFFFEDKPAKGAWMPSQVVDFLIQELDAHRFYIICPDNDVDRATDNLRMTWTMQDITENRPPLSRWHPDYQDQFTHFLQSNKHM